MIFFYRLFMAFTCCFPFPYFRKGDKERRTSKHIASFSTPYGTFHVSEDGSALNLDKDRLSANNVPIASYIRSSVDNGTGYGNCGSGSSILVRASPDDMIPHEDYTHHTNNPFVDNHYTHVRASLTFYRNAKQRSSKSFLVDPLLLENFPI